MMEKTSRRTRLFNKAIRGFIGELLERHNKTMPMERDGRGVTRVHLFKFTGRNILNRNNPETRTSSMTEEEEITVYVGV